MSNASNFQWLVCFPSYTAYNVTRLFPPVHQNAHVANANLLPTSSTHLRKSGRYRPRTPSLAPPLLSQALKLRHPQRLFNTVHKVPCTATHLNNAARFKELVNWTTLTRHSAEEDADVAFSVRLHDLSEHLRAGAVKRCDTVDVEDDVLVMFCATDAGEGGVRFACAVVFEATKTGF
jgi:hypothetical protein